MRALGVYIRYWCPVPGAFNFFNLFHDPKLPCKNITGSFFLALRDDHELARFFLPQRIIEVGGV